MTTKLNSFDKLTDTLRTLVVSFENQIADISATAEAQGQLIAAQQEQLEILTSTVVALQSDAAIMRGTLWSRRGEK